MSLSRLSDIFALLGTSVALAALRTSAYPALQRLWRRRSLTRALEAEALLSRPSDGDTATTLPMRVPSDGDEATGTTFYITAIDVTGLRCFTRARADLRFPGEGLDIRWPNVNVLLGINGAGKSTLIRAIAMASLGPVIERSEFVPYEQVRRGHDDASITAAFSFGTGRSFHALRNDIHIDRHRNVEVLGARAKGELWDETFDEEGPAFFVVGYGTHRRVTDQRRGDPSAERGRQGLRYRRVASIFDESVQLAAFVSWLPQAPARHQREVEKLLDRLLPHGTSFTGTFEGPEPIFLQAGLPLPFAALSDGYRSYIGWLGDLLFRLSTAAGSDLSLRDVSGIVLVDEVDLLLHPAWQRTVVPTVAELLPKMQFIFTTHSPIVASTVEAANIIVAQQDEETGVSELVRLTESIYGRSAEQVLLSPYFRLTSTRPVEVAEKLGALSRAAVTGDDEDLFTYLKALTYGPEQDSPALDDRERAELSHAAEDPDDEAGPEAER